MYPLPPHRPPGVIRRVPLGPHDMAAAITPADDLFVLSHLGIPDVNAEGWTLVIDGMVEHPMTFTFDDLCTMPAKEVEAVHQCAGNPLTPHIPARRVANVVWRGVDLRDVLAECRPSKHARYLWSYGADHGEFGGAGCKSYVKDLPVDRIAEGDVLLAHGLNGCPLPRTHGYPLRLVVPGFYATNSVKWLYKLTLADRRADSLFTTRFYNDPVPDVRGEPRGRTSPVWAIAPESVIVAPADGTAVSRGSTVRIWGWAWSSQPLAVVEITLDGGRTWSEASIQPGGRWSWRRFDLMWTPQEPGRVVISARATVCDGATQPAGGFRNAVHEVTVAVDQHVPIRL